MLLIKNNLLFCGYQNDIKDIQTRDFKTLFEGRRQRAEYNKAITHQRKLRRSEMIITRQQITTQNSEGVK